MNRAARRRAQKATAGYQHRLITASASSPQMANELRGRAVQALVEHDLWCAIRQRGACSCVPGISLVPFDGGTGVYEIDALDHAHRSSKQ